MATLRHIYVTDDIELTTELTYPERLKPAVISIEFTDLFPDEPESQHIEIAGTSSVASLAEALIALGNALQREWNPRGNQPFSEEVVREA